MSIITPYTGGVPNPNNPGTFNQDNTDWVAWLAGAVPQINAAAAAVGFNPIPIEAGNWSPQLWDAASGGNEVASYSSRSGRYVRLAQCVIVVGRINAGYDTAGMTVANTPHIRGLPFPAASDARGGGGLGRITLNSVGAGKQPTLLPGAGCLRIADALDPGGSFATGISITELGGGTIIFGSTYFIS